MSGYMSEIGAEIGQSIVDHAMYISTLAAAILSGMVVMRYQFKFGGHIGYPLDVGVLDCGWTSCVDGWDGASYFWIVY